MFLKNQANLELFNNKAIPANVTNYYVTQLFAFDPNFKPVKYVLPVWQKQQTVLCEPYTAYNLAVQW